MPIGTLVNVATIIVGSALGLLLRRGLPDNLRQIIFQAIGLSTLVIGMLNAFAVAEPVPDAGAAPRHLMVLIFSMLLGGLIGEAWRLEDRLTSMGEWLKRRLGADSERFSEGMVTAFLIYCIGPMTIVGALNEGTAGDSTLLYAKAILDGFMSIALVSTFGIGVAFSVVPLLVFQVAITLLGRLAGDSLGDVVVNQLTAVGGVMILGLGINILEIKKLRISNLLPALVVVVILTLMFN